MIKKQPLNDKNNWLCVNAPTSNELQQLRQQYQLDQAILNYALDPYEKARIEHDEQAGATLFIFDVALLKHDLSEPDTMPMGILLTRHDLITFTTSATNFVNQIMQQQIDQLRLSPTSFDRTTLLMAFLYQLTTGYFKPIAQADVSRIKIQRNLQKNRNKNAINDLMGIETGLVYLLSSIQDNLSLLQEMKRHYPSRLSPEQLNALEDVLIEAQQGLEMAQMSATLTQHVSDAYNKVLDNNLNQTMKFLTAFSIILAIPPIVSGFYGQNMKLPLANTDWAWEFTIIISLILIIISALLILNKHWWR